MSLLSRSTNAPFAGQTANLTPFYTPPPADQPHDGGPNPLDDATRTAVLVGTPKDPVGLTTPGKGAASELNVPSDLNDQSAWNIDVQGRQGDRDVDVFGRNGADPADGYDGRGDRGGDDYNPDNDGSRTPGGDDSFGGFKYGDKNGYGGTIGGGDREGGSSDNGDDTGSSRYHGFGADLGLPGSSYNNNGGGYVPDDHGSIPGNKRGGDSDGYGDGGFGAENLGTGPNSLGGIVDRNMKGYGSDREGDGQRIGGLIGGLVGGVVGYVAGSAIGRAYDASKAGKDHETQGCSDLDYDKCANPPADPPKSDSSGKPDPNGGGNRPSEEGGGTGGPKSNAYMPADDGAGGGSPVINAASQYMPSDDSSGGGTPSSNTFRPSDEAAGGNSPRSNALDLAGNQNLTQR